MTIGFRVRNSFSRLSNEDIQKFKDLPVANISDAMNRMFSGGAELRAMHRKGKLLGSALPVKTRPGDNLMIHKAIDIAHPGDVIVVDGGGCLVNAVMGELMLEHAIQKGVAGFIIYGAIRDSEAIYERNLPVFALGVNHRGPYRVGPGEVGFSISIGSMIVNPGDLIVGDADGVIVVPQENIDTIYQKAQAKFDAEQLQMEQTKSRLLDRSWVDKELQRLGCEFV